MYAKVTSVPAPMVTLPPMVSTASAICCADRVAVP